MTTIPEKLMINAEPVEDWPKRVWAQWKARVAPQFSNGERCSLANYAPPRSFRNEWDTGTSVHSFVYTVQPGNRVCQLSFGEDLDNMV